MGKWTWEFTIELQQKNLRRLIRKDKEWRYRQTSQLCDSPAHAHLSFLTNYMEQSPSWEANIHLASQEITRLLWNPKVYCRVHKNPHNLRPCAVFNDNFFMVRGC